MRVTNGLLAIGLAAIIALAGTVAGATPVAATDPSPAPTDVPSPAPDPSASPAPTDVPSPAPDPSASPDPLATPAPDPGTVPSSSTAVVTPTPVDRGLLVRKIALRQRWDRYVAGAAGPNAFDCSGLVRYSYNKAGVGRKIGGRSARAMLTWGRMKGLTSRRNPQIGDVVIWGNGRHAGIYIGKGYVISALNPRQDIKVTRLHALSDPFTTFIHTRI